MHCEEFDRFAIGGDRLFEPRALIAFSLQIRQETRQRCVTVDIDVCGDCVEKRADLIAPEGPGKLWGGHQFDVQADCGDHTPSQVEHGLVAVPPQPGQLGR